MMNRKRCARCKKFLPATSAYFHRASKASRTADGLHSYCHRCNAAAVRAWRHKNYQRGCLAWRQTMHSRPADSYWFSPYRVVWDMSILAESYPKTEKAAEAT